METFSEHLYRWDDVFQATSANDFKAVESLIIQYRINVNIINQEGLTLLHICATYGHVETAKVLLSLRASTTIRDRESGWTALHRAVYFRHVKITLLLVQAGAQMDADWRRFGVSSAEHLRYSTLNRDHDGLTPLDLLSRTNLDNTDRENVTITHSVMCFGKADFILGVPLPNSAPNIIRPRRIETLDSHNVVDMVASKFHSLALSADGHVFSWGHGRSGKLGHGNEDIKMHPCVVEGLLRVVVQAIAASESHSLAVTVEGDLYSWGSDRFGQLGLGTVGGPTDAANRIVTTPRRVDALRKMSVVSAAAGEAHSLCFTKDGELYAWGSNQHCQLGLKPSETSCGSNGVVSCTTPKRLSFFDKFVGNKLFKKYGVLQIAASYSGSLVLCGPKADSCFQYMDTTISDLCNQVYQWGYGITAPTKVHFSPKSGGRRSRGSSFTEATASDHNIEFLNFSSVNIAQISAGKHHNAAVCSLGVVYTWGLGSDHLGHGVENGTTTTTNSKHHLSLANPQIVEALLADIGGGKIVSISATLNRTCAVSDVGDLYTWGSTYDKGVLGVGPDGSSCYQPVPERVSGIKQARKVSAGEDHTLVLAAVARPSLPLQDIIMRADTVGIDAKSVQDEESEFPYFLNDVDIDVSPHSSGNHRKANTEKRCRKNLKALPEQESNDKLAATGEFVSIVPSLLHLCQREVSKSVSIRTAIPTLLFAEMYSMPLLAEYTLKFMEENLDSILVESKSQDINKLVETIEIDSYSPEERSTMANTSRGRDKDSNTSKPPSSSSSSSSSSALFQSGSMERNRRALDEIQINDETVKTAEEAAKMIRSIKKKLSHIDELESKRRQDRDYSLSIEQEEKLSRKKGLHSALAKLEQYQLRYSKRAQPQENIETGNSSLVDDEPKEKESEHPGPATVTDRARKELSSASAKLKGAKKKAASKPPDFSEWGNMLAPKEDSPGQVVPASVPILPLPASFKGFESATPTVTAIAPLEEPAKATKPWNGWTAAAAASISTEMQAPAAPIVESKPQLDGIVKSNSVKSLKDILKEEEDAAAAKAKYKSVRKFSWGDDSNGNGNAAKPIPLSTATPSGRTVLSPAAVAPSASSSSSGAAVTPSTSRKTPPALKATIATDQKGLEVSDRRGYDLADFFLPASTAQRSSGGVDTVASTIQTSGGMTPGSKTPSTPSGGLCWASPPLKAADKSSSTVSNNSGGGSGGAAGMKSSPRSFSAIQEEEEMIKRNSNMTHLKGNEMCPWNVERRARAESMEEVMRRQSREKQEELEFQEQLKSIAEMERLEKEKSSKRRNHRNNKTREMNNTTNTNSSNTTTTTTTTTTTNTKNKKAPIKR